MASRSEHKTIRFEDLPSSVPVTLRDLLSARIPIPISAAVTIVVECMKRSRNGDAASVVLSPDCFVISHDANGRICVSVNTARIDDGDSEDERAAVRKWGAILYDLLTTRPAACDDIQIHRGTPAPTELRLIRHGVAAELERVIVSCLAEIPQDRPRDLARLATLLIPLTSPVAPMVGSPYVTHRVDYPSPPPPRTSSPRGTLSRTVRLMGIGIVGTGSVLALCLGLGSPPRHERAPTAPRPFEIKASLPPEPVHSPVEEAPHVSTPIEKDGRDHTVSPSRPIHRKRGHKLGLAELQRELNRINGDPRRWK